MQRLSLLKPRFPAAVSFNLSILINIKSWYKGAINNFCFYKDVSVEKKYPSKGARQDTKTCQA